MQIAGLVGRRFGQPRSTPAGMVPVLAWVLGTSLAVAVTIASVQVAGSKVTSRAIPSLSPNRVQAALIADAVTLSSSPSTTATSTTATLLGSATSAGAQAIARGTSRGPGGERLTPFTSSTAAPEPGSAPSTPTTEDRPATKPPTTATFTWAVKGGTVSVRCSGDRVTLVSSTPADGVAGVVSKSGPEEVEVHFRGTDVDTEVRASCSSGAVSWRS